MTGPDVVSIARGWIGTPYVHQASKQGVGTDCLGLVRGIWREMHGTEPEAIPRYTADWSEPQGQEVLWAAADRHMQAVNRTELIAGDVILFRMRRTAVAKHLGIVASTGEQPTFIHAYTGHGVVESPLSEPWRKRIVAQFVFR
ncbi:MAG: C40 family peptidase [Yoonia sp.]|nr:C40 family peptidase [Yoonia sp.]